MGTLRLLLAISVVFAHSATPFGFAMTNGPNSVQAFYIISGFLISLVLNERYTDLSVFYRSRLLRIFPSYWLWLALTIFTLSVLWNVGYDPTGAVAGIREIFPRLDPIGTAYVLASNLLLLGQEWQFVLTYDAGGQLHFTRFFWTEKNQILPLFPVGPAWSLAVELCFYAVAPFVVRHVWRIALVFALAMALRWCAFRFGFGSDPYTYRFLPIELGTFMIGSFSFHVYRWLRSSMDFRPAVTIVAAVLLWSVAACFQWLPSGNTMLTIFTDREIILYGSMFTLLPFAFMFTAARPLDRLLGELSFPLYLCHFIMIPITLVLFTFGASPLSRAAFGLTVLAFSLVCAALTYAYVDRPIDRIRHRISAYRPAAIKIRPA